MLDLLYEGALTVAILKRNAPEELARQPDPQGPDRVADFSYTSDTLAQMIVDAWVDDDFRNRLLIKANAKPLLAERGFFLENPVVITEEQYNNHYRQDNDNEIVFVLPDIRRVTRPIPHGQSLLETARLLMAITPNGI
jgi:hypothetical protein